MKIPYDFEKCIVCQDRPPGDPEHLIPEVIGGRLQGYMLCNTCNHRFGSELVSKVKHDPSIRLAIESMKDRIPRLYARWQKNAVSKGLASDGSAIRVVRSGDDLRVLPGKGVNDSVILDTKEALSALATKLDRASHSPSEIEEWKRKFEELEEDVPLELPTGEVFVKHPTPQLKPELGIEFIEDRLVSLIAFEYLSLQIGKIIHADSFHFARNYILLGIESDRLSVEHYSTGKYDALHSLLVQPIQNAIKVDIRLFRWMAYVVTFWGFDYRGPDSAYMEDLEESTSLFAPSLSEARKGEWLLLN
jgi:hypothetical protein